VRRLAVVGAAGAGAGLRSWVAELPTAGGSWLERLEDAPLDGTDVLWLRAVAPAEPRLRPWLEAGGRLLATGAAVVLPSSLGLDSISPTIIANPDPPPADLGLAGFGAHPLFAGMRDGASLGRALASAVAWGFERTWPGADVVAVERRGFGVDAGRVLAWEHAVGHGGVLCLGLEPSPAPGGAGDGELLLANALVGDAIPHGDRISPAVCWPRPGHRAVRDQTAAVPMGAVLEPRSDTWPESGLAAMDRSPAAAWTHAGRRLLVRADAATGEREVWVPPFRVMRSAAVRDAIPCAPGRIAADEVTGGLALGGHRLLERWLAAPDTPLAVWEIAGIEGVPVTLEWSVDLRRAWPYPTGAYGDLVFGLGPDGRALEVRADGGPRASFFVSGGALAADADQHEARVRVTCTGATPIRLVAVAGVDGDELARALKLLAGGVQAVAAARTRKAAQLDRYGTAFEAPEPRLASAVAWARQRGDEALVGVPGVGRSLLTGCPREAAEGAWCFGAHAVPAAAAQLIAGNRDPARELLKFLAQAQRADGGIAAQLPVGGLAAPADLASTTAFLHLAERLLAWTGDLEPFRRLRRPLGDALIYLAAGDASLSARLLDGIEALIEGQPAAAALARLRHRPAPDPGPSGVEPHAVVEAAAAALRRAPGALVGSDAAPALLEAVGALWGLDPEATEDALAAAPRIPSGWAGHGLRGLRVGRSVLDLEARRRPSALVVRVTHRFGPRLVLTIAPPGLDITATDVDDVELPASRARFEAHDRHEVRFHLAG
jgi:hypothetical protein